MKIVPPPDLLPGLEETWDALGKIRHAIEEAFPRGWILSADETAPTISAEIAAIVAAVERAAEALPPEVGPKPTPGRHGHA